MANKKYEETDIQAIAAAIKEKTGSEEPLYVRNMASGVGEVFETGNEQGLIWAEDIFIHSKSDKNVVGRYYLFTSCDLSNYTFKKTFKPIGDCQTLFYDYRGNYLPKNMDLSEVTSATTLYTWATELQEIPDYGLPAVPMVNRYNFCRKCHTIECIRITETLEPPVFKECVNLVNLAFEGVIGKSISAPSSPLSIASLKNIITHLKDYAPDEANHFKYTLTVKASAWDALVESGFTDDDYSWILSTIGIDSDSIEALGYTWTEIVGALCWNLTLAS